MDLRDILNTASRSSSSDDFFSRIIDRFIGIHPFGNSNIIMSAVITLFTFGIFTVVFLYVVFVFT